MKSLLFDFGGTLDADGTSWLDRFYPLYRDAGIEAPREAFNRAFYDSDDNLASRFSLGGLSLEQTLNLQAACVLEALSPGRLGLGEAIVGRFLKDCRRHFLRNRPVLERLGRAYKLGVVSNFYGNLEGVLKSEGFAGVFEAVADSAVVGSMKPAPEIFLHAMKALSVSPAECVMVGDSIPRDMRGAEGLNLRHVLLSPEPRTCCPQGLRARSLPELEALLS